MRYTPKKTVQMLVEQRNDYVVTVKGNQPKLVQQFQAAIAQQSPHSEDASSDYSHGRQVNRRVQVFAAPETLRQTWAQAASLVVVYRTGVREQKPFATTSYYLSSLSISAIELGLGIRQHRDIENGLHWVRDVVFEEDAAPFREVAPALNWSVLRTIGLNLFRSWGEESLTKAIRRWGHDLVQLLSLLTTN
jgi:predicted transposase YbfD/YdcC